QPARVVQSLRRVRIAEEDGVVEIEDQRARDTAKHGALPARQQTPLHHDMRAAQAAKQPQSLPPVLRQWNHVEMMASPLQGRLNRRQTITASSVFRTLDQRDESHETALRSGGSTANSRCREPSGTLVRLGSRHLPKTAKPLRVVASRGSVRPGVAAAEPVRAP